MDLRLLPLALGLWLSTAGSLVVADVANPLAIVIWLICLCGICFWLITKNQFKYWNLTSTKFLILGLVLGVFLITIRIQPLISGPVAQAVNEKAVITISGEILDDPRRSKSVNGLDLSARDFGTFKFKTQNAIVRGKSYQVRVPILVYVSGDQLDQVWNLPPGTELTLTGKISNSNLLRGAAGQLSVTTEVQIDNGPPNFQNIAFLFRDGLHRALDSTNSLASGLVPGLAIGDESRVSAELENDMKAAGLAHLTAVSGSNVTLLIAIVLAIGSRLKFSTRTNYYVALIALAAFVVIVRPQPSVLRASAMGVIMVIALLSKSAKSPLPALIASVVLLIALDPWLAISFGFALSVFATAGLLLWAKALLLSFDQHISKRIPGWILTGLVVTVCAQVAVFPLMIALGAKISLGSLPANLISVPLAGPTMVLGLLAALVAPIFFPLAQLIAWLAILPATIIAISAKLIAGQSWLIIPWPTGLIGVALSIGFISYLIWLKINWIKFAAEQKAINVVALIVVIFIIWQPPTRSLTQWVPSNWQIVSCDVGQGDATVIRTNKNEAVLIDVGGDPELIDSCLTELKIKKIPLLLLTHFHADHVVGLPGAIANRDIGQIRVSPLAEPPLTTEFVNQVLQENELHAQVLTYPEYIRIGQVELFTVWPKAKINGASNTPNNASVSVLVKTENLTALIPGDVEPIAQDEMLKLVGKLKVDVLKIPHHGSRYQSKVFAQRTAPQLAIVSCGENNSYGHPAIETIYLYELIGAKVVRTDQLGSIAIGNSGERLTMASKK